LATPAPGPASISLLIGGDCGPVRNETVTFPIEHYSELIRPVLQNADLRFVNCMRTYSSRGADNALAPQVRQSPEMAKIFTDCGFEVITLANNHIYDSGPEAMMDTRALLLGHGIQVTGAGRNLAEARQPAIVEKQGVRVGYLGYCSTGHHGSEAGPNKPGIATLRVKTTYEPRGPHAPVRVLTRPDEQDLAMLVEDINALRKQVDIVIPALHCGMIRLPRIVPDYHVTAARACIDAGADMVVSHSPHIPKGIEVYKGKVIFYSLGVFSMTKPFPSPSWSDPAWVHGAIRNHTDIDPDYPFMPYGKDCTRALLAKAVVSKKGVERVSFLPVQFDRQYRAEALRRGDPRFADVLGYMEWVSDGFNHNFTVDGDEVVVTG